MKVNTAVVALVASVVIVIPASAAAHGAKKSTASATSSPRDLGTREAAGLRLSAKVTQAEELEIELLVERKAEPPDPILGAWVRVADSQVTMALLGPNGQVASEPAHAEQEVGTYGVHLASPRAGQYTVRATVAIAGAQPINTTADFALDVAPQAAQPGMAMEMDMTHPFLAHMGLPDPPGAAGLRVTGIRRAGELGAGNDMAIHLEAGILPRLGIHLRNDAFTGAAAGSAEGAAEDHGSELMVMYALALNAEGTSGVSVFGEVAWPTVKGDGDPVRGGAGVAGRFQLRDRFLFDGDVHVSPNSKGKVEVEYETSFIFRPLGRFFAVVENRGGFGPEPTKIYLLPAAKVAMGSSGATFGLGLQFPLTKARDYDRMGMVQIDLEF